MTTAYQISFQKFVTRHMVTEARRREIKKIKHGMGLVGVDTALAMGRVGAALTKAGIVWWLSYGVLLGLVRQNGFVADDDDVDIMLAPGTEPAKIVAVMTSLGAEYLTLIARHGVVTNENYWCDKVYFDFYYGHDYQGKCVDLSRFAGCACFLEHDMSGFRTRDFRGQQLVVPVDEDRYLQKLYGPTWRTPDAAWNWKIQMEPLAISGNPLSLLCVFARREIFKR